ncbi:MAG: GWxTD domain-containing protein, partial [Ignavibacteriaceae bacterium]
VKYDSLNPKPYLTLSSIYENNNEPGKGIPYLKKLIRLYPENKDAHLYLGLLYYRTSQMDSAYIEYQKAIYLMDKTEKDDFIYNSVKVLLEPYLKNKLNNLDESLLKQVINLFWKERDPLNLTPYNERLLEHYTRVAYSNLRFSVPELNVIGWKTDRGTVVIRYGIPPHVIRIRDKTFSFVDISRNGEYIYGVPGESQYWDDTQQFAKDLLVTQPEEYHPKFEGPVFSVPNAAYQLKDFKKDNLTDLFISYGIKPSGKTEGNKESEYAHTSGIFLFDSYFREIAENKNKIKSLSNMNKIEIPDSGSLFINTEKLVSPPDSGNLAFEIIRDKDKGVSSYHGKFKLKSFNSFSLEMSDIVLASVVNKDKKIAGRINRMDYSILPNPTGIFSEDQDLYIYYEVYNLEKNERGLTDFQQTIILQKKGEEGFSIGKLAGSVLKFIGMEGNEQQIGLTSKYQTNDKNSSIYLQLDMKGYDPGNYVLSVKIKDNINCKEIKQNTNLIWK